MEFDTTQITNKTKGVSLTVNIAHGFPMMMGIGESYRNIEVRFVRKKYGRKWGESHFDSDSETGETFIGITTPDDPTGDIASFRKDFFSGGGFDPGYNAGHAIRGVLGLASSKGYSKAIFILTGIDMAMITSFKKLREGLALHLGETKDYIEEAFFLVEPSSSGNNPRYGELLRAFGITPAQATAQANAGANRPKKHHKKAKPRQPGMVG